LIDFLLAYAFAIQAFNDVIKIGFPGLRRVYCYSSLMPRPQHLPHGPLYQSPFFTLAPRWRGRIDGQREHRVLSFSEAERMVFCLLLLREGPLGCPFCLAPAANEFSSARDSLGWSFGLRSSISCLSRLRDLSFTYEPFFASQADPDLA